MSVKVIEFELIDHGIDNPSYFQGCGTAFTRFNHVVTGVGDTPREALDDALEMAAQGDPSVDAEDLFQRIIEEEGDNPALVEDEDGNKAFPEAPSAYQNMLEANGLEEPDRDDFESDEEYETALEEYEEGCEEFNDCESNYYHISIRYNLPDDRLLR